MVSLFHQNMRRYGGGSAWKNGLFDTDFAAIQAITGAVYAVGGFTEITNNQTGQHFATRALSLDPGFDKWTLIELGITALGTTEYLGIAWDSTEVNAQHSGQVIYDGFTRRWTCHNTAAPPGGLKVLPKQTAVDKKRKFGGDEADTRGLAYIAGTEATNGTNCIFGFMHNMNTLGNKSGAYRSLNDMAAAVVAATGYMGPTIYIGGDFNVPPNDPLDGGLLHVAGERDAANTHYLNTTSANPFDFWLTDDAGTTNGDADIFYQTLASGASDHAGIKLIVW